MGFATACVLAHVQRSVCCHPTYYSVEAVRNAWSAGRKLLQFEEKQGHGAVSQAADFISFRKLIQMARGYSTKKGKIQNLLWTNLPTSTVLWKVYLCKDLCFCIPHLNSCKNILIERFARQDVWSFPTLLVKMVVFDQNGFWIRYPRVSERTIVLTISGRAAGNEAAVPPNSCCVCVCVFVFSFPDNESLMHCTWYDAFWGENPV